MRIIRSKQNHRKRYLAVALALTLVAICFAVYWVYAHSADTSQDVANPTSQTSKDRKRDTAEDTSIPTNSSSEGKTLPQPDTSTPNNSGPASGSPTISLTIQNNPSDITVISKIPNPASGRCALNITNESQQSVFSANAEIIYQDSFSSCAGFSVPKSQLPGGTLVIDITTANSSGKEILNL